MTVIYALKMLIPLAPQFGHAGASASGDTEKAKAKNAALAAAGAIVPRSFQELDQKISAVFKLLIKDGVIVPKPEPVEPQTPMDFGAAQVP
jgi:ATP citrate (pro-S)-lyase